MLHAKNLQLFLYRLLYACIMAIIIGTILIEGGGGVLDELFLPMPF